ncbi:hypothetical protein GCM10010305_17930 [Streptomyces termitum]|uniref:DUF7848 domain-containing protein n=1 Tax=Streptomyces termitum TaxID=67368 RepID=A0A918W707_9ACTN|nr:hypothetical protein GCM10010305_17930 [Streptomyces termitum]
MIGLGQWEFGYVLHRIQPDPATSPSATADCLTEGCEWTSATHADADAVNAECLRHTGLNPQHDRFGRAFADVAVVHRMDPV